METAQAMERMSIDIANPQAKERLNEMVALQWITIRSERQIRPKAIASKPKVSEDAPSRLTQKLLSCKLPPMSDEQYNEYLEIRKMSKQWAESLL